MNRSHFNYVGEKKKQYSSKPNCAFRSGWYDSICSISWSQHTPAITCPYETSKDVTFGVTCVMSLVHLQEETEAYEAVGIKCGYCVAWQMSLHRGGGGVSG